MPLNLEVFKKMTKEEIKEYGKNIADGYTRDKKNGNVLTYKDSGGYWYEFAYDEKGNILSFKDSNGFWYECAYDENGRELTYKDSSGDDIKYFFWGKKYNLGYDKNTKKYLAGCQTLTYEECEEYYKENKDGYVDSHDFIEAIREHQKALTSS